MQSDQRAERSASSLNRELIRAIACIAAMPGDHESAVPELKLHRRHSATEPLYCILPLGLAFTAQGDKQVQLADRVFAYGPGESMLTTVDLPVATHVTRATPHEPYLAVTLQLDPHALAAAMTETGMTTVRDGDSYEPISVQHLDAPVLDALLRLIQLLGEPRLLHHLAPLIKQEIILRLLTGPHASHLSHILTFGIPRRQVVETVAWLKQHFAERVEVDELARRANMSTSSYRQHFRTITGMSPVQFQKRLRLQEARKLMLNEQTSAASASARVGYESATQFNREYRRLFGAPPQRDVQSVLSQHSGVAEMREGASSRH